MSFQPGLQVSETVVYRSVLSFPSGSAGGLDSLRPQHLKDLLACPTIGNSLLSGLTEFINFVLAGGIPTAAAPSFFGAFLVALNKKDGGVRPIAVGSTLRRLASKAACAWITKEVTADLIPLQLGCGVPHGAEVIAHAARRVLGQASPNTVMVKIDFYNAFNCISRSSIMKIVADRYPSLLPYVRSAYYEESNLVFGDVIIPSAEGVQQGDPLGPLLFCIVIQPLLQRLTSAFKIAYLDDVTIAGSVDEVTADLHTLQARSADLGLCLNLKKCEVISHNSESVDQVLRVAPLMKCVRVEDATLLGTALSSSAINDVFNEKLDFLSRMESRDAPYLLRHSLAIPRLVYLLRTSACFEFDGLQVYDDAVRDVVSRVLNLRLSDANWLQASLPVSAGGLGIRSAVMLALSAFLASCAGSADLTRAVLPHNVGENEDNLIEGAVHKWRARADDAEVPTAQAAAIQRNWDGPCVTAAGRHLDDDATTERDRARLLACRSRGAGAWLHAVPMSSVGLRMTNDSVRIAVGLRLGADLCLPHKCVCGKTVDAKGIHGLSCTRSAGRHARHNAINDIIQRSLAAANIPAMREPPGIFRSDSKRPDGMSLVPWSRGRMLVWDATIPDTLAPSHLGETSRAAGAAARKAENGKHAKYAALDRGYIFIPVAVETLGAFAAASWRFIGELGARVAAAQENANAAAHLKQRVSVAVQRGNAASVLGTMNAYFIPNNNNTVDV